MVRPRKAIEWKICIILTDFKVDAIDKKYLAFDIWHLALVIMKLGSAVILAKEIFDLGTSVTEMLVNENLDKN